MLHHYIKVAFRNLSRNKVFSIINILGLSVGMSVCLLIYQYIHFELSFDRFHENAENIYRLTREDRRGGEIIDRGVSVTKLLGPVSLESMPEIKKMVRVHDSFEDLVFTTVDKSKVFQEARYWYVDSNFLDVFDYPVKYGDMETALSEPHHMIITAEVAERYFGDQNPVGNEIVVHGGRLSGTFSISAVLEQLPANSHFQFDFLMSMDFLTTHWRMYRDGDGWDWYNFATYVVLEESSNLPDVETKFDDLIVKHIGDALAPNDESVNIHLQSLTDIHLKSDFPDELTNNTGNERQIYFYLVIAVFILIIAWVNYINLFTAQSLRRTKEIGVRKSIGAFKRQLVWQFMIESLMHNVIGAAFAIFFAYLCLPMLNDLIGYHLELSLLTSTWFWFGYVLIILLGAMLAGYYPAFVVSGRKSINMLGSKKSTASGSTNFRRGLIAFQFLISVLLISGTYLVHRQTNFMMAQELGVNMEQILVVNGPRVILDKKQEDQLSFFKTFHNNMIAHHSIVDVSGSSHTPSQKFSWVGELRKLGTPRESYTKGYVVFTDAHFAATYDLEFVSGTGYSPDMTSYEDGLIINESAVEAFGLGSPNQALQEKLIVSIGDTLPVLAVVKDFHWQSLRDNHYPMVFALHQFDNAVFSVKLNTSDFSESIAHIQSVYYQSFPNDPFIYYFLDEAFNRQYQADLQFGSLFAAFSGLAIFIACLGLFALVSFSATLRVKEIGIRKVLGAGMAHLMGLLSKEYLLLLLLANALALPAVWYWGSDWLDNYAFKIDMGIDMFLFPFLILLVISILTVSYQTFAAANANPVDSLRSE